MNTSPGGESRTEDPAGLRPRRDWRGELPHLLAPALFLLAALVLPSVMLEQTPDLRGTGPGPAAWPGTMLALAAVCAALWLIQELVTLRRGRRAPAKSDEEEEYVYSKAVIGLVLIVAYGSLLSISGFALTTVLFMALWCVLGGVRNPLVVVPVSLIGTTALLWMFMGLALMPLPRGVGVFDQISITILQGLGIY